MSAFAARAPGKLNLCLFVGTPRDDGLHPIVSVVQPVSLADELRLVAASAGATADEVHCPGVEGPNLAERALAAYRRAAGWEGPPVRLDIVKRVPVAAGMGGGSADAAAALRLAAHAAGRPGDPLVTELAPGLGADVPAQVEPRRALVTGVGERVEPLAGGAPCGIVVVPLRHALSTADVYHEADRLGLGRRPNELRELEDRLRAALPDGTLPLELACNDLEAAARSLYPPIDLVLAAVSATGAARSLVSGSGPTVFGLYPGRDGAERARRAAAALVQRHPGAVAAEPVGPEFAAPWPLDEA